MTVRNGSSTAQLLGWRTGTPSRNFSHVVGAPPAGAFFVRADSLAPQTSLALPVPQDRPWVLTIGRVWPHARPSPGGRMGRQGGVSAPHPRHTRPKPGTPAAAPHART